MRNLWSRVGVVLAAVVLVLGTASCGFDDVPAASPHASPVKILGTLVSAGEEFTCAVVTGDAVQCWGRNDHGQLGDGTKSDHRAPAGVISLSRGVQAVTAGGSHACALTFDGVVKCWGSNLYGQLGDGTTEDRTSPVEVRGLGSKVQSIAAAHGYTCALSTDGGLTCWGDNRFGQLGDGTTTSRTQPVHVLGLAGGVQSVAAGFDHACALLTATTVKCWGWNDHGWLGDGTTKQRLKPAKVVDMWARVQAIASSSSFTCTLTTGGKVKCWGFNDHGELGIGETTDRETPEDVRGLSARVVAVATGEAHACALSNRGRLSCWGSNDSGQVGDGSTTGRLLPVDVKTSADIVEVSAGQAHTCAVAESGAVLCWGNNAYGQLGDGTTQDRTVPIRVAGLG